MNNREKKSFQPLLIFIALAIGLILGRLSFLLSDDLPLIYKHSQSQKILQLLDLINQQYVDKVQTDSIVDNILNDILSELDPHSHYFNKNEYISAAIDINSEYKGIGLIISFVRDTPIVKKLLPNSPAGQSGLIPGDMLLKIDSTATTGLSTDSIVSLIKNSKDTVVNILAYRKYNDSTFIVHPEKKQINLKTVYGYYIDSLNTAYIKIDRFSISTYKEFDSVVHSLLAKGADKMILDLRDNAGGVLGSTLDILQEFYPENTLMCYVKGKSIIKQKCYSKKDGLLKDIPLIVLINKNTASASEIIAGSLQDNDRAVIIGTRSFGKGLIQSEFKFKDGSVVRLTTSRYYTPSGRCLQKPYDSYMQDYLFPRDTVILDTNDKYTTVSGRTVYGGGGVFPDILVKDTLIPNSLVAAIYVNKLLVNYGPVLQTFSSQQQIVNFVDTTMRPDKSHYSYFSTIYQLDDIILGTLPAIKYYNAHSKIYKKALEVIQNEEYKTILQPEK